MIPARYSASRFPGKLMQDLGGKTVILRTYEATVATHLFDEVYVVTDSDIIYQEIIANGGKAIMSVAEHESGSDRIAEAIENIDVDIIVNVQGDEPLIPVDLINQVANTLQTKPDCAIATAAVAIENQEEIVNPNAVKVVLNKNNEALYFSRSIIPFDRSQSSPTYYRHLGIYAYRARFLRDFSKLASSPLEQAESLEQLRALWHGFAIAVYITSESPPPGVDTQADLDRVRQFF